MEMKSSIKMVAASSVTGIVIAGAVVTPAFAWHPKGQIIKYVQNQTAGGQMVDANDDASAVSAKPGDLLKYTVVVSNVGDADDKGMNDMAKTVMTDTLPSGVELLVNPAQRTLTEDMGTVKPGQKVTKEYVVKVTSDKDGDLLDNKACFTGNSTANDNPQSGCDSAKVKVSNPKPETPPEQPKTPETPAQPQQPQVKAEETSLPNTGAGSWFVPAGLATSLGYAGNMLRLKRRAAKQNR
jgi:uncharacterized repeat protein (TIGR01451 family)